LRSTTKAEDLQYCCLYLPRPLLWNTSHQAQRHQSPWAKSSLHPPLPSSLPILAVQDIPHFCQHHENCNFDMSELRNTRPTGRIFDESRASS
jgi:hypothetical protein